MGGSALVEHDGQADEDPVLDDAGDVHSQRRRLPDEQKDCHVQRCTAPRPTFEVCLAGVTMCAFVATQKLMMFMSKASWVTMRLCTPSHKVLLEIVAALPLPCV